MLTSTVTDTASTATTTTTTNDLGTKDIFLKLLVAQMEYQDPLKPQDATAMSSQLAQFNMVEQQTTTNQLLDQLLGATSLNSTDPGTSGASYLGHSVTVDQSEIYYNGINQDFSIVLDEPATSAVVYVMNSNGEPVKTIPMYDLSTGSNPAVWDGTTDAGALAPQDTYYLDFSAVNVNGSTVSGSVQRVGIVDSVRFTSSGTELVVGGIAAPLSSITEIRL